MKQIVFFFVFFFSSNVIKIGVNMTIIQNVTLVYSTESKFPFHKTCFLYLSIFFPTDRTMTYKRSTNLLVS